MKKLLVCLLLLVCAGLHAYPDHLDDQLVFGFNPVNVTLQDFIEDEVGLTNSDLNYDEATILFDAGLFACNNGGSDYAPTPITYFGQIISWTCSSSGTYQKSAANTLFNIGVLVTDIEELCGDDFTFGTGRKAEDIYLDDLFPFDVWTDGDWTNIPGIGLVFIPNGDYIIKHGVYSENGAAKLDVLATELINIFEDGGVEFETIPQMCVYNN